MVCHIKRCPELKKDTSKPQDQFYIVHLLCFFAGLSHFVPLTFFTNATGYWSYKFRNTTIDFDAKNVDQRSVLQTYFASAATIATTLPLVIFMSLTTIYGDLVAVTKRIVISLSIMVALFIVCTIFIQVDTDDWQLQFFVLAMILFAVVNAANAVFGVSSLVIISKFPNVLLKFYLSGQGIAGIFNSLLQILSLGIGTSVEDSALIYFMSGCFVLIFTMFLYFLSRRMEFYQFYMVKPVKKIKKNTVCISQMKESIKLIWTSCLTFLFASLATSVTTPSVTNLMVSEYAGTEWGDKYFVPVCSYLLNNLSDTAGRTLTSFLNLNLSGTFLTIFAFIRLITIVPAIFLCNAWPRSKHMPVVFTKDYQYIIIVFLFGFTRGYLFNSAFLNVRRLVPEPKQEVAFSVLITVVGITAGITDRKSVV